MFPRAVIAVISGLLFGLGLLVSGMNNPDNIRGFLDIFGHWRPELIAVMAAAVIIFSLAFQYSRRKKSPWFSENFHLPKLKQINSRLIIGAGLFGIGWGLVGLCPGPTLVDLANFNWPIYVFLSAMVGGNRLAHYLIGPAKTATINK